MAKTSCDKLETVLGREFGDVGVGGLGKDCNPSLGFQQETELGQSRLAPARDDDTAVL